MVEIMNSPTITVRIEPELLKVMDKLVSQGIAKTRSDLLRKALLKYLSRYAEIDSRNLYLSPEL